MRLLSLLLISRMCVHGSVVVLVIFIFYIVWCFDTLNTFLNRERLLLPGLALLIGSKGHLKIYIFILAN